MSKYVVGRVSEFPPGTRRQVMLGSRRIAVFNVGGRYYGLRDICPHRGALLSDGTVLGSLTAVGPGEYCYDETQVFVKCPWHGWEFDLATGQSWCDPEHARVRPYAVTIEGGAEISRESSTAGVDREPGPYVAETVEISVEDEYLVVRV
jgi:nitrite reductase/ring-hydroxylating ferredoxin subunit